MEFVTKYTRNIIDMVWLERLTKAESGEINRKTD